MTDNAAFSFLACSFVAVNSVLKAQELFASQPEAFDRMRGEETMKTWGAYKIQGKAALIPVMGMLIPNGTFRGSVWGMTSQEGLRSEIQRAADDPEVEKLVLMVDSPGGFAAGTDTTATLIRQVKEKKPVIAVVSGQAASAAYWLAAQADEIVASPTSEIGSIGVLAAHMDVSANLAAQGVKITVISSGRHKTEGSPYGPLSESARFEMQKRVDDLRVEFAKDVVVGREGKMDMATVLNTEGATFLSAEALKIGLIDRVGHLDSVICIPDDKAQACDDPVDEELSAGETVDEATISIAEAPAPPVKADRSRERFEANERTKKVAKARIKSIMMDPLAKGREGLAQHFAFDTDLPLSIVRMGLEAAPKNGEKEAARPPTLAEEMRSYKQPIVGSDAGPDPSKLSFTERGAISAKRLLGKV